MKPLRGKAKVAHEAQLAAERQAKQEAREARRSAGLPVTDTEDENVPLEPTTPETKAGTKRRTGPKERTASGTLKTKAPAKKRPRKTKDLLELSDDDGEGGDEGKGTGKRGTKAKSSAKRGTKNGKGTEEVEGPKTPPVRSKRQIKRKAAGAGGGEQV